MTDNYKKAERIEIKKHPQIDEKWVQELIANDTSIIGLGDLVLRDKERVQPRAGRLDILLQDPDTQRRYEVEVQLGPTDESHIIRTIEYWDIERKRYPNYDHCAVIIAEDITSRFFNVISLFNGTIPIIAINMQALQVGDHLTLVFTKVMDELSRGPVDEDEDTIAVPANRDYWEKKATKETVILADKILNILHSIDPTLILNYTKHYIGLKKDSQAYNFVQLRPRKKSIGLELKLPQSTDLDAKIEDADFDTLDYDKRWKRYRINLTRDDIEEKSEILRELSKNAYERRASV